jgi:hypothetical protein
MRLMRAVSNQALRAAEQRRRELEEENEALRLGVDARDQALRAMEEEVERSAEVLDSGKQTREVRSQRCHPFSSCKNDEELDN